MPRTLGRSVDIHQLGTQTAAMAPPHLDSIVGNPIFIRPEHIATKSSKLIVERRGMSFSGGDITVWSMDSEADAGSHNNNKLPPSYICKGKADS